MAATATAALAQFYYDFEHHYQTVEVSAAVVARAIALAETHALRAYDAVQLATALESNNLRAGLAAPPLTLVSADQELNAAATAEGLAVEDPNSHP